MKNLFFYTHQNFLTLIEVIINRLPPESNQNIWAHSLQAILLNKSSKKLLHCGDPKHQSSITEKATPLLMSNNESICELIRGTVKGELSSELNSSVLMSSLKIAKRITKHSV
jgi:Dullard-like phosphatase family protein